MNTGEAPEFQGGVTRLCHRVARGYSAGYTGVVPTQAHEVRLGRPKVGPLTNCPSSRPSQTTRSISNSSRPARLLAADDRVRRENRRAAASGAEQVEHGAKSWKSATVNVGRASTDKP
jgi:hypothetical protein